MNYLQIYEDLILKAKSENRKKLKRTHKNYIYYENHHIIPKCLGGDNSKKNLVLLTAKEHFIAHKLLVEILPEEKGLIYALWLMSNVKISDIKYRVGSREYQRIRKLNSENVSKNQNGENNPFYGKTHSKKSRKKIKDNHADFSGENHPQFGIKHSEERLKKASISMKKYYKNNEHPLKGVKRFNKPEDNPFYGKKHSEESLKKIRKAARNRKKKTCKYCSKTMDIPNYFKYHGDKCKLNPKNN